MRFDVNTKRIKTRELIEAEQSNGALVALMSRFMVDGSGQEIPQDEAYDQLLDLDLDDLMDVCRQFMEGINVPNMSARR